MFGQPSPLAEAARKLLFALLFREHEGLERILPFDLLPHLVGGQR